MKKPIRKRSILPPFFSEGVVVPQLRSVADQMLATRAALDSSKKKLAAAEKAIETMRKARTGLLATYADLQRKLADEALLKPE